ncbi:activating enzyme subunit 2 [Seminavis robusta]|uniref:SUMO-activating enzyme subunit n=1 Tax=Seminavis robusta TaxID=568900 RepID=A0A9N8DC67_9STRA|nr:activating enzyme subunit 2 [Seminavis robusta]|eukprot:Sro13_g009870.1 activating enzyme subunit 2 (658) ;mRNA; f:51550-53523
MTSNSGILSSLTATLGPEVVSKIESSKILLVGSGGIGCELIKNLTLTGFRHVETIDMDTIDVSNLNRQLLFRSQHVGKSKCEVACQVAVEMLGTTTTGADEENKQPIVYQAHHGNVCDNTKFNVHFVKKFDLVLNALDNVTARRRVNRLCLAASVPLVEAGTTGYLGQVNVMDKASGVACYECITQETQKVYPICTIRSTPSMPVHTIVWAKELYKLLFADKLDESMLYEDPQGEEPSTYMKSVDELRTILKDKAKSKDYVVEAATALIKALYVAEIQKQLDMGRYAGAKKTPAILGDDIITNGAAKDQTAPSQTKATDQLWTPTECVTEVVACLLEAHAAEPDTLLQAFDKDDDLAMRFVASASNLRSHVFQITPLQSLYSAKGIAGNIIPAIATTNAVVAGLQMIQVINILKAKMEKKEGGNLMEHCRYINCIRQCTRNGLFLIPCKLQPPNPKCFVCRDATLQLAINVNNWTLQTFLQRIVKKELGFEEPTLLLEDDYIWEEGEDADSQAYKVNLPKVLSKLPCGGMQHGTVLKIEDFSQDLQVNVAIAHQDVWEGEQYDNPEQQFHIGGDVPVADSKPAAKPAPAAAKKEEDKKEKVVDDDSDIECWDGGNDGDSKPAAKKRPSENKNGDDEPKKKKAKTADDDDDVEVIEID